jgi:hypothetical protein
LDELKAVRRAFYESVVVRERPVRFPILAVWCYVANSRNMGSTKAAGGSAVVRLSHTLIGPPRLALIQKMACVYGHVTSLSLYHPTHK